MKKLILFVLLSTMVLLFSCSKEENNNPLDNEAPVEKSEEVSKNFIPLEENVVVTNYNKNGNVSITYSGTEPKFVENKSVIVVDVDTMGYLRKVVSVQKQGNTINLTTKQAYFSDVFKRISFKLSTKAYVPNTSLNKNSTNAEISKALTDENGFIHPVKVVYHSRLGKVTTKGVFSPESIGDTFRVIDINKDFSNTDLYGKEGDNVHFYISEGYALFQSDAVFDFESDYTGEYDPDTKIKKSELKKFEFYLVSKAEFQTKLDLDMQAGYTKEGNPKIFDMKKVTMKFLVGAVPVWISMDCDIYGKYKLFADAKMNSDWGFKSTHKLKIGGTYIRETDSFIPISKYVPTNKIFPLNIAGEVNANAHLEIYPRAEVLFYSFFGPYAEVAPYVEGNYNAAYQSFNNNFLAWNSNVDLGLDMRVGLKLTFLWGLFDEEFAKQNINCFDTTLWSAPYDLVLQSNIPASTSENSLIEIKYKVFDKLGIPVFAVPIHFSGDGTTSPQMVITNIDGEATVSWGVGNTEGEKNLNATIYKADGTIIKQLNHTTVIKNNLPPNNPCPGTPTVTYSGKTYNTVQIGDQCWLKENLDVGTMINVSNNQTDNGIIEKYCYGNNLSNCNTYGGLYQWDEAMQYVTTPGTQGICPEGWHIPTIAELQTLNDAVGGNRNALKAMGQGSGYGAGTNTSGFSALLAGGSYTGGGFYGLGNDEGFAIFWSSTENGSDAGTMELEAKNEGDQFGNGPETHGFSVRCIKGDGAVGKSPQTPTLSSPANSATGISLTPTLIWNTSTGATSYTLQVSTDDNFTNYIFNQSGISETSMQINGLNNDMPYYWRVNASNSYGTSGWSTPTWSFTTGSVTNLNVWSKKADFGGAGRSRAVGFSIGTKGYIGTGYDGSYKKDFWEYDPQTNAWTQKADFGGAGRYGAVGFSIYNKGYIGTGYYGIQPNASVGDVLTLKDFWEYDPNSDTWTRKADINGDSRLDAFCFTIGQNAYIGSGYPAIIDNINGNTYGIVFPPKNDMWQYNTSTNTWIQKADFVDSYTSSAFSIYSKGYVISYRSQNNFWEYDPQTNAWTQKADFDTNNNFISYMIGFAIGGKGYAGIGSISSSTYLKDFWEYTP